MTRPDPGLVIDASALVNVLLGQPSDAAEVVRADAVLHAPALVDLEVLSALHRLERTGRIDADRAAGALDDLRGLGIARYPLPPLQDVAWELRTWARISDAYYLALSFALDAPLATDDRRLFRAAHERGYSLLIR